MKGQDRNDPGGHSGNRETGEPTSAGLNALFAVLFTLRAVFLLAGLDRLPLVPAAPPEVIINDPAVALSRGFGLRGFSFEHSLNGLDVIYANFPPLDVLFKALIFRLLGFSAMTLRVPGVLADLVACAVFLLVIRELKVRGILDRTGAAVAGFLLLLDPATLMHTRTGRMESLCALFGALALWLCVRAEWDGRRSVRLLFAASIAAGFALSTHFGALVCCVVPGLWSLAWIRRLRFRWIAMNVMPLVVVAGVWVASYGANSARAWHELQGLSVYAPKPSLGVGVMLSGGAKALISDGLGLFPVFLALAAGLVRIMTTGDRSISTTFGTGTFGTSTFGKDTPFDWKSCLLLFPAIVLVQCVLIQFIVPGFGSTRIVMVIPFAAICLGVSLSHAGDRAGKAVIAGAAVIAAGFLAATAGYLRTAGNSWQERSPARFDALVEAIPAGARVVAVPELWFAFLSHNRRMALIYHADAEYKYWSDNPRAFDPYDVVILDPLTPEYDSLHLKARAGRPVEYRLRTYGRDFTVDARVLDVTKLDVNRLLDVTKLDPTRLPQ